MEYKDLNLMENIIILYIIMFGVSMGNFLLFGIVDYVKIVVMGYVVFVIICFGMVGNGLFMVVLIRKFMYILINCYFFVFVIWDIVVIFCILFLMMLFILLFWFEDYVMLYVVVIGYFLVLIV